MPLYIIKKIIIKKQKKVYPSLNEDLHLALQKFILNPKFELTNVCLVPST
jgi:hypothetical protein